MRRPAREVAIQRRGNATRVKLTEHDPLANTTTDLDLSAITRMVLTLVEADGTVALTLDTDVDADAITWTDDGIITFAIGDHIAELDGYRYASRLTGIDISGDATELVHPDFPESSMDVIIGVAAAIA